MRPFQLNNETVVLEPWHTNTASTAVIKFKYESLNADPASFRLGTIVDGRPGSGGTYCFTNPDGGRYQMMFASKRGAKIEFVFTNQDKTDLYNGDSVIEIFDIELEYKLGEPSSKRGFGSSRDYLYPDGRWIVDGKQFTPIGIYANNNRRDWSLYARQGFNLNMWAPSLKRVKQGADSGLYSLFSIGPYLWDKGWAYGNGSPNRLTRMAKQIDEILSHDVGNSHLIGYYMDNECYRQYKGIVEGITHLRAMDSTRPIYFLHGNVGMAQAFSPWCNMTGTYIGGGNTGGAASSSSFDGLRILHALPQQQSPVVFAQVNGRGRDAMRMAREAIGLGLATGLAHWSDRDEAPVDRAAWWGDFPDVVAGIMSNQSNGSVDENEHVPEEPDEDNEPEVSERVIASLDGYELVLRKRQS